jgi:hypothetical protein
MTRDARAATICDHRTQSRTLSATPQSKEETSITYFPVRGCDVNRVLADPRDHSSLRGIELKQHVLARRFILVDTNGVLLANTVMVWVVSS